MPKHMPIQIAILAALVLAVTFLVFQSRALTARVQALEAKGPEIRTVLKNPEVEDAPSRAHLLQPEDRKAEAAPDSPPGSAPQKNPGPAPAEPAPSASSQEEAIARQVEKILKEKYGHLPKTETLEPIEKVLERELNLTASQKERIIALLKKKDEEAGTIFKGGNPFSGANLQRAMEHDAKYETAIKNELDAAQQAKYDQLKKDGKINSGIMIRIDAGGDDE